MIETTCTRCKAVYDVTRSDDLIRGPGWWRLCPACRPVDDGEIAWISAGRWKRHERTGARFTYGIRRFDGAGVAIVAYSEKAKALRRCTAATKAGDPCQGWALWDDPRQLCAAHAGRTFHGTQMGGPWKPPTPTRYIPCRCVAYNWPHRPGGGICRWPDDPEYRCTIPARTKAWWRP